MNKSDIILKLNQRIKALRSLSASSVRDPTYKKWKRDTEIALEHMFGKDTRHISDFRSVRFTPTSYNMMNPNPAFKKSFSDGIESMIAILESMTEEVKEYWSKENEIEPELDKSPPIKSNKIFIVHGHNEAIRESVARLLEKLKLEPIILHEQPNKGYTIIEKFIDYSDVVFSVVLLTADDSGGKKGSAIDTHLPRARQNVFLELGFFLGRLGRERVCALYEEGVEVPSDYSGVLFIPLDEAGGWRLLLGRELRAAGIDIDLNSVI